MGFRPGRRGRRSALPSGAGHPCQFPSRPVRPARFMRLRSAAAHSLFVFGYKILIAKQAKAPQHLSMLRRALSNQEFSVDNFPLSGLKKRVFSGAGFCGWPWFCRGGFRLWFRSWLWLLVWPWALGRFRCCVRPAAAPTAAFFGGCVGRAGFPARGRPGESRCGARPDRLGPLARNYQDRKSVV